MRTLVRLVGLAAALGWLGACGVALRFPTDVQTALVRDPLRRLETERFIIYYPAHRRAEVDRFLVRAERCASTLRDAAVVKAGAWNDKMVIAMPDAAFNNAFVAAEFAGYEHISVIPLHATLDFSTEFGLPPDPGLIACHELVHYVQLEQIAGFWGWMNNVFGHLYTPQIGFEPWFSEGLATYYEAKLSPGAGRPAWPIFTGMFAAGYAGERINGGDLSALGRRAPPGHHYLVGSMFVQFLAERYGEGALWAAVGKQARALTGLVFTGAMKHGFGTSFGNLLDQFAEWAQQRFPVRERPAGQRVIANLGSDARYARGRDGTEAWVARDVDAPPRLVVRAPDGVQLAAINLVDVLPPRTLVQADPLLVSGLSITADGREVWLTAIDLGTTFQVPRLLRWRRGESSLTELTDELGPGATIDPSGATYYYCAVDGDRWSLAVWSTRTGARRTLVEMQPGTYVLGAQISPNGATLVANVWDGSAFVAWLIDAATGARLGELRSPGAPIWDASFTDDGRVIHLGVVDGRFQVIVDGRAVSDVPYAALAPRSTQGSVRFLNRHRWSWTLDEIAMTALGPNDTAPAEPVATVAAAPPPAAPPSTTPSVATDEPYSVWERVWFPQLRMPYVLFASTEGPHLGGIVGGGDRLGMQRWTLSAYAQLRADNPDTTADESAGDIHFGAQAAYLNTMLSPWQILVVAGFLDWVEPVDTDDPDVTIDEEHETRDAVISIGRVWRGSFAASLSGIYTEDVEQRAGGPELRRRLGGPGLALAWSSDESTAYTGARRGLFIAASAAYYPRQLSSFAGDITDTAGTLAAVVPLLGTRRHTLQLTARGRALHARDDTGLLQIGGSSGLSLLWDDRSVPGEPPEFDRARFPPNLRFVELLRGYEDYAITSDRAAIAELSWRYPVIIDRGSATTLWFLPASFIRQLDFELFATGALDAEGNEHAAVGAAVSLRLAFLRVPLIVAYQIARRIRDDEAVTQLVGLGADL